PDAGDQRQPAADPPQQPVRHLGRRPARQHGEHDHHHRPVGVPELLHAALTSRPRDLRDLRRSPMLAGVRPTVPPGPAADAPAGGARIRHYQPGDAPALYQICLRTGDRGEDATGHYTDPDLLGHVYVGPYLALAPRFAFVLDDGAPVGYALGVPDTAEFARACERSWWPPRRTCRRTSGPRTSRSPRSSTIPRSLAPPCWRATRHTCTSTCCRRRKGVVTAGP